MQSTTDRMRSVTGVRRQSARRRALRALPGRILFYCLMLLLSALFALPLVWLLSTSLKTGSQAFRMPPEFIPNPVVLRNYVDGLTFLPFSRYVANTLLLAAPRLFGAVFVSALVVYGFSRIEWDGRDAVFFLCVATMIIPYAVTMIPQYILFHRLGWVGGYLPLFVPSLFAEAYYIFLLRQFFMGIPSELSDAARVDGAGDGLILWRIILPMARPALAVVALFQFMWTWSEYLGPLIYLSDRAKYTVTLGLSKFGGDWKGATLDRYTWFMAATASMTVPILVLFFFVQRSFIEGISLTGLKG
ncbi:MAG: carbohydrate ABC transporter permease [Anaerolineae bacterium]